MFSQNLISITAASHLIALLSGAIVFVPSAFAFPEIILFSDAHLTASTAYPDTVSLSANASKVASGSTYFPLYSAYFVSIIAKSCLMILSPTPNRVVPP